MKNYRLINLLTSRIIVDVVIGRRNNLKKDLLHEWINRWKMFIVRSNKSNIELVGPFIRR